MEDDGWDTRARRARRHARVLLQRITLPDPFDLDEFLQVVAADRGRPIKVRPLAGEQLPTVPCGLWIAGETVDWVFVENSTSPLHREHIVLHEVAHMICGHHGHQPSFGPASALGPGAGPDGAGPDQLLRRPGARGGSPRVTASEPGSPHTPIADCDRR